MRDAPFAATSRAAGTRAQPDALRCVTWNIHRARGRDGRVDPRRCLDALAGALEGRGGGWPEVLALQEADAETPAQEGLLDLAQLEALGGLRHVQGAPDLRRTGQSHGFEGVVLFLAPALEPQAAQVIDLPGHCARGAVVVEALAGDRALRIVTTHLSLSQPLRILQMRTLAQFLARRAPMQTLLLGDLNEWRPWGGLALHPAVAGRRFAGPWRATFPARAPVLPLDRILSDRPGAVRQVRVLDTPALRAASDHLPLAATVRIGPRD